MPQAQMSLVIEDSGGETSVQKLNFTVADVNMTAEQLENVAQNWAEAVDDVITGAIREARISVVADISGLGLKVTPDPNSDVEEGARFNFRTAGGYNTSFRIPTFSEALFVAGSHLVNIAALAVDALLDRAIDGIEYALGIDLDPSDSRGDDIVALTIAESAFQKERKRKR